MDKMIHTPEGVRDVFSEECKRKRMLEQKIEKVFQAYGYQEIETPTFEFFDVFGREVGTTPSRELYNFLTGREIPLCSVRISLLLSHGQFPCTIWKRIFRSAFGIREAVL